MNDAMKKYDNALQYDTPFNTLSLLTFSSTASGGFLDFKPAMRLLVACMLLM